MADHTLQQLEDLFYDITFKALKLDPLDPVNDGRVRMTWPTEGAPTWQITDNVIFLTVGFDDDPITRQTEVSYSNKDNDNAYRNLTATRVLQIGWVAYGSSSFNDMHIIRRSLVSPAVKEMISREKMALIVDVPSPVRSPELYVNQWWERSSFYARFNELTADEEVVPYIKGANLIIKKD